ncbi:MAG: arsenate reductase (azurin) small subunit [Halobacteriales archaeon]
MSQGVRESRRRFLAGVAGATAAVGVGGCIDGDEPGDSPAGRLRDVDKYPRMHVASLDELDVGEVVEFDYPLDGQSNFLTKLGENAWKGEGPDGDVVAFSSLCTHMGCSVADQVEPENGVAGPCPCHYTTFDLEKAGMTVTGPATTDLPQVRLEVEDDSVYATGVDGLVYGYRANTADGEAVEGTEDA